MTQISRCHPRLGDVLRRLIVLTCCAAAPLYAQEKAAPAPQQATRVEGEGLFDANCAGCHGLDGHGGQRAPDIVTRRDVQELSDAAIGKILREGITGTGMPAFRSFDRSRIEELVQYLRSLQGEGSRASLPGSQEAGKSLFFNKAGCSECHMVGGAGGFIGSDLTSYGEQKSAKEIREAITNPRMTADAVVATMMNGEIVAGIVRNEDNFSLQLQTRDGTFHFLEKSKLRDVEHKAGELMPADYSSRLTEAEINNLVSYLMSADKARSNLKAGSNKAEPNNETEQ